MITRIRHIEIDGEFFHDLPDHIQLLVQDVKDHGEVHAVVEELEHEIEIRMGTTYVSTAGNVLRIVSSDTEHVVPFDRIAYWYLPRDFYHD